MRAALAGLDEGTFTEDHELDRKWQVPAMIGRRLTQEEAKRLLGKLSFAIGIASTAMSSSSGFEQKVCGVGRSRHGRHGKMGIRRG